MVNKTAMGYCRKKNPRNQNTKSLKMFIDFNTSRCVSASAGSWQFNSKFGDTDTCMPMIVRSSQLVISFYVLRFSLVKYSSEIKSHTSLSCRWIVLDELPKSRSRNNHKLRQIVMSSFGNELYYDRGIERIRET